MQQDLSNARYNEAPEHTRHTIPPRLRYKKRGTPQLRADTASVAALQKFLAEMSI